MATMIHGRPRVRAEHRFYLIAAIVMAAINVAGFSFQHAMGRSSFAAPPIVHAHAIVFFGWVTIYLAQNILAATGSRRLHRRLGWIAAGWIVAMIVFGTTVTVRVIRAGHAPFFFEPAYFLVMNPVTVLTFAGLSTWAIVLRRRTEWHKRLHLCGMAMIMGQALGRLLPLPLLIPYVGWSIFAVTLLFPIAGVIADIRRSGRVHPAWWWGMGTMTASYLLIEAIVRSPLASVLYAAVTAGSPGAAVTPLAYPPFPAG